MNIEGSIARTTVSDAVYRRLRDQILASDADPGAALPSERTLSETFGVNRHAVREAIKRLQQAGLVTVVHGGATRVRDWRHEGGPDLIAAVAGGLGDEDRAALARRTAATRAAVARLLVERAADAGVQVAVAVDADGDAVAAYRALWREIASASDNLAAQLTLNSLDDALMSLGEPGRELIEAEAGRTEALERLVQAIAGGDSRAARRAVDDVLGDLAAA